MNWCGKMEELKQDAEARLFGLAFEVAGKLDEAEERIRELEVENERLRTVDKPETAVKQIYEQVAEIVKEHPEIAIYGGMTWPANVIRSARETLAHREKEAERLREREDLWRNYVRLLSDEMDSLVPIAHIHGWRASSVTVEQGKELRKQLGIDPKGRDE